MVNFTKIFGLAGAALVFAGLASAQSTCTTPTVAAVIDRGEGTTELIPTITIACPGANTAGTVTLQLFMSLPVTSKAIGGGFSEAQVSGTNIAGPIQGVISGNTISFTGITTTGAAGFTIVINNLRVNASGAGVTVGGSPVTVSGTAFVSGSAATINPAVLTLPTVALLENGLAPATVSTSIGGTAGKFLSPTVCQSNASGFFAYYVNVNENFPTAFKTAAGEASQVAVTGSSTNNAVADGTRVQITFANVPANVSVYVPVAPIVSQNVNATLPVATGLALTDQITLTNSGPGTAFAGVTAYSGGPAALNALGVAPVTISSGTGTATFETTVADPNNLGKFSIPVYFVNSAFAVPAGTTSGITAAVSLSPIGSTVIPNFSANSATTLTTSVFSLCNTTLLFPFVTNQLGFDTGLAIANTSTDPLGTTNGAIPQAGTCTLNFYGSGAPSPANVVTPNIPTGTVYAQALSGIGAGFQGYMIAVCSFQYAHAFAFITDGVGSAGGLSQGYLAGVIPGAARAATESLGF